MYQRKYETIERLKDELDAVRQDVLSLARSHVDWLGYYECKNRGDAAEWQDSVVADAITRAEVLPDEGFGERAYCPLCGQGSSSAHVTGYAMPAGLEQHLTAWGRVRGCVVTKAAFAIARDHWNEKFRPAEKAKSGAQQSLIKTRRLSETLYRIAPDLQPHLLGEGLSSFGDGLRNEEQLAWAEQRLTNLGFLIAVESNVKCYMADLGGFVVYADPRGTEKISFTVYKKPIPKATSEPRQRFEPRFELRDSWKNDIRSKYEVRLARATVLAAKQ